jgi:hypothetical protein
VDHRYYYHIQDTQILKEIVRKPTFLPLVSSLALRAALVPLLALILVARAADREGTLIAGNKDIASC